ncbi:acyl-CoA desaturase [Chitinophaga deserti]|uniref:acyl-CoA desaturase n=1 Tax=Chitinophaga deserti TaxID=2164099 RepID=UPI000D6BA5F7|nr:acyl-CoA desaturase [Chitinophaga deserti]
MLFLLFFILHWYLSLFSQTFFQHRYAAHKAFRMNNFWEKFFHIFAYLTQGSSYMSPRAYGIMHRMHHAYTDTEKDPHSPQFSKNVFTMMWHTRGVYLNIVNNKMEVEERFEKGVPTWPAFDRWAGSAYSRLLWVGIYTAVFILLMPTPWLLVLLPITVAIGAVHGAIINWFAHKYGYHNFKMKNTSRNLFNLDVFMLGESYHNNHHKRPSSINFGFRWHELDPVYPVIRLLAFMRIIHLNKPSMVEAH